MGKVQLLPPNLINQIAAGEVIERPASVIKELLDNSLDAGATQIEIIIKKAGRELISITDNGCGMSPEDAKMSLERHATSKISSFEELTEVRTMGFRGEALPSIASISHLRLITRAQGYETATQIVVQGGQQQSAAPLAANIGTSISVEHLFFNVPARRKFLKSDATEQAHCMAVVKAAALGHHMVGFTLREGKRVLLQAPAGQTLKERVQSIFGSTEGLLELNAYEGNIQLSGLISTPSHLLPHRNQLYFFVNNRAVDSRMFNIALREAYGATLTRGYYPAAYVFLSTPANEVDVNVHPAKREVRFRKEQEKTAFLIKAMGMTLASQPGKSALPFALQTSENGLPRLATPPPIPLTGQTHYSPAFSSPPFPAPSLQPTPPPFVPPSYHSTPTQPQLRVEQAPASRHSWQFVAFLHSAWALYSTPEGLAIVSVSAAQERVAYEAILAQIEKGEARSQTLLIPALLQLEKNLDETLQLHLHRLTAQGYIISPFGTGTYRLEAIPSWLNEENGLSGEPEQVLLQELYTLAENSHAPTDEKALQQALASRVARHAQTRLQHAEAARSLIDRLLACKQPLKSPSGAPTVWLITLEELEKRFFK